jgi:O-antigen/teichoic acid export membrane protein
MKSVLTRGSIWVTVGYGGSQVIRLGGNLVLWRLLNPKAFGIMAIINVLMQGLQMFSDVGIGPSIIQNERGDDPVYLNTAWTIQAGRGFLLFLVSVIAAVPVAKFYGEPLMASMIPVVGLGAAISGFNSTALFTVVRKVALGRVTFIELASQAGGLIVMIVIAFIYRTIWGIVIGGLVSNALRMALGHVALPGIRNRLVWDPPSARTLMQFGRWIFLSTLLTFAVGQSDRLIFGKVIPIDLLGVYSIATVWANLPTTILDRIFSSVLFPILSRFDQVGEDFAKAFRQARTPALMVAGWMSASLISGGPVLIRFLYDQRAVDAGWIVQSLSIGTWLLAIETTNSTALLARGKANWMAIGSAGKLLGMFVAIPVGFMTAGFPGAVFGYSVSELLRYITSVAGGFSINLRSYRQDLTLSACLIATAAAGWAVGKGAHHLLAPLAARHSRPEALVEGLAIMVVVGLGWLAMYRFQRARDRG